MMATSAACYENAPQPNEPTPVAAPVVSSAELPVPRRPRRDESDRWVHEHGDAVWRFALARTSEPAIAEEVVQETFLAALRKLDAFAGRSAERTWLLGIASNKIADHFRKVAREQRRAGSKTNDVESRECDGCEAHFTAAGRWAKPPTVWPAPPVSAVETADDIEALRRCIDALPPGQQSLVWMRELSGMSAAEICAATSLTESNLWTRLHRARMALRNCLERAFGTKRGPGS